MRNVIFGLALALSATPASAQENKVSDADMEKVNAALSELGCQPGEEVKKEEEGVYEIDDAKCKGGTMDVKLDKDFKLILMSRY